MPADAVASFTPAIAGMSGTSVGASGEMAVDMGASGFEAEGSALYHLSPRAGRGRLSREAGKWGEGELPLVWSPRIEPLIRLARCSPTSPRRRGEGKKVGSLLRGRHLG